MSFEVSIMGRGEGKERGEGKAIPAFTVWERTLLKVAGGRKRPGFPAGSAFPSSLSGVSRQLEDVLLGPSANRSSVHGRFCVTASQSDTQMRTRHSWPAEHLLALHPFFQILALPAETVSWLPPGALAQPVL